jgi:hypothetical protein
MKNFSVLLFSFLLGIVCQNIILAQSGPAPGGGCTVSEWLQAKSAAESAKDAALQARLIFDAAFNDAILKKNQAIAKREEAFQYLLPATNGPALNADPILVSEFVKLWDDGEEWMNQANQELNWALTAWGTGNEKIAEGNQRMVWAEESASPPTPNYCNAKARAEAAKILYDDAKKSFQDASQSCVNAVSYFNIAIQNYKAAIKLCNDNGYYL